MPSYQFNRNGSWPNSCSYPLVVDLMSKSEKCFKIDMQEIRGQYLGPGHFDWAILFFLITDNGNLVVIAVASPLATLLFLLRLERSFFPISKRLGSLLTPCDRKF